MSPKAAFLFHLIMNLDGALARQDEDDPALLGDDHLLEIDLVEIDPDLVPESDRIDEAVLGMVQM